MGCCNSSNHQKNFQEIMLNRLKECIQVGNTKQLLY